jgi:hypothetical protein
VLVVLGVGIAAAPSSVPALTMPPTGHPAAMGARMMSTSSHLPSTAGHHGGSESHST